VKKIFGILLALALTLSVSLVATTPVAAATINVPDDYSTIQEAIDAASPGDTISVAAGTYAGAIVNKDVTISGASGGTSVIDTGVPYKDGSSLTTAFRLDSDADGAEISDFTINCDANTSFYFAIFARAADDVTIDSLQINDTVQGISNWGGSGWTITDNTITDTVAAGGGGIGIFLGALNGPSGYGICCDNLVQYNTIDASASAEDYSCPAICLSLDLRYGGYLLVDGSEDISGNQILDNTITASAANNLVGIEVGTILGDSEDDPIRDDPDEIAAVMTAAAVHDNTVQDNSVDGADMGIYFYNVTDLTITENTVENSVGYGIYAEHGQSGTVIQGNTFSNNNVQLKDETIDTATLDPLDIATILNNNTFDRAVTVDHPGASLLHVIWSSIQDGIDAAVAGDTVNVAAGTYVEDPEIVIDKNLSIIGAGSATTIIKPSGDTASNGAMFVVNPDITFHISDVTLDGTGKKVWYALKYKGGGSVTDCDFKNIQYNPSGPDYNGIAICAYGEAYDDTIDFDDNVDITGCTFTGIGRVGVLYFGPGITDSTYSGNTYIGKGDGDWLDYALDVGSGPNVTITGNTISDCTGVASSDGSTSCGIMVTDYYKGSCPAYSSTEATITENNVFDCTAGIGVGYDGTDASIVVAHYNNLVGNDYGVDSTAPLVDARYNYWGDETGPSHDLNLGGQGDAVSDNVDFSPWLYKPQEQFVSGAPCYAGSVVLADEATEVEAGSYDAGWNSFSTPITLDGSADTVSELLALTTGSGLSIQRAQRFDLASQAWVPVIMGDMVLEDYEIKPGEGFFIQVSSGGSIPILVETDLTSPPQRALTAGWNLIGMSGPWPQTVENALTGVSYSVVLSPKPPNDVAWSVPPAGAGAKELLIGEAYWVAMGGPGILFGFTTTPVADDMTWDLNQ
jgi:parallel beta-helix repeat protein